MSDMRRRAFITLLGGVAAWPLAARAQQADRVRRIGALMTQAADDPEGQSRLLALAQGLQESGWTIGRNVRIDTRWGAGDAERYRRYAAEIVALAPDVILVNGPRPWRSCNRRPAACRSCSRMSPTRWAPGLLSAWRGRVAMPPVLCCLNTARAGSRWSCSRSSRHA
jgi:hypothetical protein